MITDINSANQLGPADLALLSFIADVKKDNVIFAMEEPEIALPPHTQRRVTLAFNRGRRIAANLSAMWTSFGCYAKARDALDDALVEDQILSGAEGLTGTHVMTIHRSKAKQFDLAR